MAIKPIIDGLDQLRGQVLDDVDAMQESFGLRAVWDQQFTELLERLHRLDDLLELTRTRPDLNEVDVSHIVEPGGDDPGAT